MLWFKAKQALGHTSSLCNSEILMLILGSVRFKTASSVLVCIIGLDFYCGSGFALFLTEIYR